MDVTPSTVFGRQTDVAFDQQGNIFVSDGYFDARVVKYDKNGRFIKAVGTRGNGNLQFSTPHSIATDFQGNVYVGDRGNARVQVLDNDLNWKANYPNVGNPWAVCVSGGPGPKNPGKQFLYVSNSWPDSAPAAAAEFTSEIYNADLLKMPNDIYVGEVAGVGANSKGQIFVYTRTGHPYATLGDNRTFSRGGSRLFQFDPNGKFMRELGQDVYGFNAAIGLRVDPQDYVWTIDVAANQVVKFDHDGRIALVLGRKPETIAVRPGQPGAGPGGPGGPPGGAPGASAAGAPGGAPGAAAGGPPQGAPGGQANRPPGSGIPGSSFNRPTDVAWDQAGNIYVADGIGNNNRVAKFDKEGAFISQWGQLVLGQASSTG